MVELYIFCTYLDSVGLVYRACCSLQRQGNKCRGAPALSCVLIAAIAGPRWSLTLTPPYSHLLQSTPFSSNSNNQRRERNRNWPKSATPRISQRRTATGSYTKATNPDPNPEQTRRAEQHLTTRPRPTAGPRGPCLPYRPLPAPPTQTTPLSRPRLPGGGRASIPTPTPTRHVPPSPPPPQPSPRPSAPDPSTTPRRQHTQQQPQCRPKSRANAPRS